MNEFDLDALVQTGNLSVYLTDHNALAAHQTHLSPFVSGIIDHHKDEGLWTELPAEERVIKKVGSACSLVALKLLESDSSLLSQIQGWSIGLNQHLKNPPTLRNPNKPKKPNTLTTILSLR